MSKLLISCADPRCKDTKVTELDGITAEKIASNIEYLLSIKLENLLLPFEFEAGLYSLTQKKTDFHWGWDSPLSHLRGTFTGHWLSAAAQIYSLNGNAELKLKADKIVDRIAYCQKENGGRWAFGIPEKYLLWLKEGKTTWAPQYVCHKVMMGLLDMYLFAGNQQALDIVKGCADWFYDYAKDIDRETMNKMMNIEETGGIMELWADLYSVTKDEKHLELIRFYERPDLFGPLLDKIDVLTNLHANTTIPEVHGAARAYEVTGEERYRRIVENYWELAVEQRGMFVTGGQTSGEVWAPMQKQAARLNDRNQEHCVVYNMMRLSQYLYSWTKDKKYADYWERNLYNGIFSQGFWTEKLNMLANEDYPAKKGLITYYLPLASGSHKLWGSETDHFWCCHCTLVQANANFHENIYYKENNDIYIAQYLPSKLTLSFEEEEITIHQKENKQAGHNLYILPIDREITSRPDSQNVIFEIQGKNKELRLFFRKPWWMQAEMQVKLNGKSFDYAEQDGYVLINRVWGEKDTVELIMPKKLTVCHLPDRPDTVAFIYGPLALVGLTNEERTLYGNPDQPESFLVPDNERLWNNWLPYFKTINQPVNIRFVPIYEIGYEEYTVYFPIKKI